MVVGCVCVSREWPHGADAFPRQSADGPTGSAVLLRDESPPMRAELSVAGTPVAKLRSRNRAKPVLAGTVCPNPPLGPHTRASRAFSRVAKGGIAEGLCITSVWDAPGIAPGARAWLHLA